VKAHNKGRQSDLKKGDTLIVREVSRLGRKTDEVLGLVDLLKSK
jgi:DNA invertase Pin-like site-specific DNA recombinase